MQWIKATMAQGFATQNYSITCNLPITFSNTVYKCVISIYNPASTSWACMGIRAYPNTKNILNISYFNHFYAFASFTVNVICIGF